MNSTPSPISAAQRALATEPQSINAPLSAAAAFLILIGYSRNARVIEKMLERMFIGNPPPLHDRILDFSKAVSGVTFFAPARKFVSGLDG